MPAPDLPLQDPSETPADQLVLPDVFDLTFEGFSPEAFAILERLRARPHIEQYRQEREGIRTYVQEPFKRYRDDLVVNWVLPNQLAFETEKNVFSRLLKNDFGAGGCHHHLWMAFYRPGRRRLTDVQLSHSIAPDGFTVGLYVGDNAKDLLKQVRRRILDEPDRFRTLLNALLETELWHVYYYHGAGEQRRRLAYAEPADRVLDDLQQAKGIWIRRRFETGEVLRWQGTLVPNALDAVTDLWPMYCFWAAP